MPQTPDVIVSLTRFTVSVLPANDVNHKAYALQVELKPHGWVVHDGHVYFDPDGSEAFSQSTAYHFADHEDALALAKRLAPGLTVNGHTATEVYHQTRRPAALPLATPCADGTCTHPLNWHREPDGCTVCACARFRPPTDN
ncbi:hypothetical protein [Streptomyces nogalater]|uniref:Uncharacterized protein n=1 Tax=Streptomyces nogalater TaxID=38314 RepID=A0ABW0W8N7_STRNO